MAFKPSLHGWGFEDSFDIEGPALGSGAAPTGLGLGGGMCWAALDRYLDGRTVPDSTNAPDSGSPLHSELRQRQVAALAGLWPRLREWQALPDGSWRDRLPLSLTPGSGDVASLTRREWRRIRRALRGGRPILLTLVESEDGYVRGAAVRQVLAYGFEREGRRVTLAIYDPARPLDDEVQLGFSLSGTLDARLTGGHRVRGFFAVPYDREPAAALRAETFGDRSVLGLNRKVHGRPAATGGRGVLHVVARDVEGALLHFHRRRGRHWEGANVTEREELEGAELHSDPVALAGFGGLGIHAFGRSYVGDLFHFRGVRRWKVTNRTENRRAGPRFRLEGNPVPVALPWGGVCVVGRGKDNALITYEYQPFRGWRADEIPAAAGGAIVGDPVAVALGAEAHVVARGRNGNVLHFERTKGGWSAGDLTTLCAGTEPAVGSPALLVHEGRLHVVARTRGDRLLHLERNEDGQWEGRFVASGILGDPAAVAGPGGLHLFAAGRDCGLIHAWGAGKSWRVEDLVATRPALGAGPAPDAPLLPWGATRELRLFGRRNGALVQWIWRPDTDWVASAASERAGVARRHEPRDAPQMVIDREGSYHLFATDGSGTVVHLEPGAWVAPDGRGASDAAAARATVRPKQGAAERPDDAAEEAATPGAPAVAAPAAASSPEETAPAEMPLDEALSVESLFAEAPAPPPAAPAGGKNGAGSPPRGKAAKTGKDGKSDKGKASKSLKFVKTTRPEKRDNERLGGPNRARITGTAGLPLLDDPEDEAPTDSGAMDLPLLDEPDSGDELFEWERPEDETGKSKNGTAGLESLDLETLENWPPTVEDADTGKSPGKGPGKGAEDEQLPPWPEEG